MIRKKWAGWIEPVSGWTLWIATFVSILLAGVAKADSDKFIGYGILYDLLKLEQNYLWWLLPLSVVVAGIANYSKSKFTKSTWETVDYLLEEYKKVVFEEHDNLRNTPHYYQRITLYQYLKWRWAFCWLPWTGWMVPVARTGYATVGSSIPRFRSPVDDPDKAEGVAGTAFVRDRVVLVNDLLPINENSTDSELIEYARKGFVDKKWLENRKKKTTSRSLIGIPLKVKGKTWGVMVIDSRDPLEINEEIFETLKFKALAGILGKLLEN